jgi:hypothetical protein
MSADVMIPFFYDKYTYPETIALSWKKTSLLYAHFIRRSNAFGMHYAIPNINCPGWWFGI